MTPARCRQRPCSFGPPTRCMGHPGFVPGAVPSPQYRSEMGIAWMTGFLDFPASRIGDGARFWQSVTGSTMSESRGSSAEFATLLPKTGDPYLRLQRIEHGSGGVHLDLHAENVDETSQRALTMGALLLEARPHINIFSSPAGVTFCVVRHRGERHRPPPTLWDGRSRSLVDQICVDTGPTTYLEEAAFWTGLTGWERRAGALSEFEFLVRPAHMPFRLLFQRLTEDEPGGGALHLDLACSDVGRETNRHVALGASVVRIMRYWTTLIDPAGMTYCVTARNPDTGML